MKKIIKLPNQNESVTSNIIIEKIRTQKEFYYCKSNDYRWFSPINDLIKISKSDDVRISILKALIDVVSSKYAIAAYIDSTGYYSVYIGVMYKDCIKAVKSSKKHCDYDVIDVITNQILITNG